MAAITYDGQVIGGGVPTSADQVAYSDTNVGLSLDQLHQDLGPVESTNNAVAAHAVGEYFVWKGKFVKATSAITVGSTIILNTNVVAITVGDILSAKNTLYFDQIACSATTGNFAVVNNANITADFVVTSCEFSKPSAITTNVEWTTSDGSLTLNGTCTDATCTVAITLVKKDN